MVGEKDHIFRFEICFGSSGFASILNFVEDGIYYLHISAEL
jgi:hypothetical protein